MKANTITQNPDYIDLVKCLEKQDYDAALVLYAQLFAAYPEAFDPSNKVGAITHLASHLRNMASLSRKALYDEALPLLSKSSRLLQALEFMVGIRPKRFDNSLQQPNFFYIPSLSAKPFYLPDEIPGLEKCVNILRELCEGFAAQGTDLPDSYLDNMGYVPDKNGWERLKNKEWASQHLIRGGELLGDDFKAALEGFMQCDAVANCPPHAPELFLSRLLPGTRIPPHYGISNVKLTVHLPIKVNTACALTAGEQTQSWDGQRDILIFDDSFLHSAQNEGTEPRTVLIFDVWHPDLSLQEREAIAQFMHIYHLWDQRFGSLAGLDRKVP